MRRLLSLVAMLLIVLAASRPLAADSAHSNYKKGIDAEKRQDYERAFEYFQEAFGRSPRTCATARPSSTQVPGVGGARASRAAAARRRETGRSHWWSSRRLSAIDPSSFIAQQEFRRTQDLMNQATNPPQAVATPSQRAAQAAGRGAGSGGADRDFERADHA